MANAELWSDWDGTGVKIAKARFVNPRNWRKYPLQPMEGYGNFIAGVKSTGVDLAGIVSRRPELKQRRRVTERSVNSMALDNVFDSERIVLTGSESAKAAHVVNRARQSRVGLIDDKPHKVGAEFIDLISRDDPEVSIILGAVASGKREGYLERLAEAAGDSEVADFTETGANEFELQVGNSTLEIVSLQPYSFDSGEQFGYQILNGARNED